MASLYIVFPVVCHIIFFMTGSVGNIFIVSVNFLDWMKTKRISPANLIISCIVIINLFMQGSIAFNQICALLFLKFYIQVWVVNSLVVLMTSLALSSLWCTTCLCFYYFVKIVTFNGAWFYKIKTKLPTMVPWLLVFSCSISWAFGLPAYWEVYIDSPFLAANATGNESYVSLNYESKCDCIFQIYMFAAGIPFTIISVTAGSIIFSLCTHIKRIKNNNQGPKNSKISSHINAIKTVTSLLITYLMFYGVLTVIFNKNRNTGMLLFIFCVIVASFFPTVNAIVLIIGNRKLSMTLKHIFCNKQVILNAEDTVTTH